MPTITDDDLKVFADIGTMFDRSVDADNRRIFRFVMMGQKVAVAVGGDEDSINLTIGLDTIPFANAKSLLASEYFGDLRRWSAHQAAYLKQEIDNDLIKTCGDYRSDSSIPDGVEADIETFDQYLADRPSCLLHVVIIDGPAGIGKTTQIKQLAYNRASRFGRERGRLLLHVESRGRVLQNVYDLIAASLQTIRAKPTYDQLGVLVRHGLVTLAIDGFDELADPNGYQLAWSQLNSLLDDVVGEGQILLAGRETFVSPGRMRQALPVVSTPDTTLSQYTMREVDPLVARDWLCCHGWSNDGLIDDHLLKDLLTPGSYALRPFFLHTLTDPEVFNQIKENNSIDLLSLLINALIARESMKFGDDVLRSLSCEQLKDYVRNVSEEIARDMADNQGETLPGQTVAWIADLCMPKEIDPQIRKTLIHRATSLPFLTVDKNHNAVRFAHRQYYVFFLGSNAVRTVAQGEFSKYLRRNILGAEFLEGFASVLRDTPEALVRKFQNNASDALSGLSILDRSAGNVASLLLSSCCGLSPEKNIVVSNCSIDEVLLYGELPRVLLKNVIISSLYATDADLRNLVFEGNCYIVSLHATNQTRVSQGFPLPTWIEIVQKTITGPKDIKAWLMKSQGELAKNSSLQLPFSTELLDRILRYHSFWLREDIDNNEPVVRHIIAHSDWPIAREWLKENDLARFDYQPKALGKAGKFIHFRVDRIRSLLSL